MEMSSDVGRQFRSNPISKYTSPLQKQLYFAIKRIVDIVMSLFLFLFLLPLFLFICYKLYVKERSPIFYKELKMGKKNLPFFMYTFRTMSQQSEVIRSFPPHPFPSYWQHGVPNKFSYTENTSAIMTQTGLFLTKYKLHKLPQLLNVMKGNISFIGPEPEKESIANYYNSLQKRRLKIRPGLTGYTQINNKLSVGYDKKIKDDLYYLKNCSYSLDIKIIGTLIKKAIKN